MFADVTLVRTETLVLLQQLTATWKVMIVMTIMSNVTPVSLIMISLIMRLCKIKPAARCQTVFAVQWTT